MTSVIMVSPTHRSGEKNKTTRLKHVGTHVCVCVCGVGVKITRRSHLM